MSDTCEHSKLYIADFANQPSPLGSCLFCEVDALQSKLDSAMKALRAAKHDLDITSWECPRCGESTPMHVIDMYDPLAEALRVLDGRCDGNHSEPPCADPQCWNGGVANEQNR